jgi:hypothetical protein
MPDTSFVNWRLRRELEPNKKADRKFAFPWSAHVPTG